MGGRIRVGSIYLAKTPLTRQLTLKFSRVSTSREIVATMPGERERWRGRERRKVQQKPSFLSHEDSSSSTSIPPPFLPSRFENLRTLLLLLLFVLVRDETAGSVMRAIPRGKFLDGDFDEPMRGGAAAQRYDLRANAVALEPGEYVHPDHVVDRAEDEAVKRGVTSSVSSFASRPKRGKKVTWEGDNGSEDSHRNAHTDVRGVPKADVASIASGRGWIPSHDDEEQVRREVEHDRDIPSAELGPPQPQLAATVPDDVQAHGREKVEDSVGVRLQIDD